MVLFSPMPEIADNPENPETKPVELSTETIKAVAAAAAVEIKPAELLADDNSTSVNAPPVDPPQTVTASQIVTDQIPAMALPPVPGQEKPKRGPGRPPGSGKKKTVGAMGQSTVIIPGDGVTVATDLTGDNETAQPIPEQAAVNYRQLAEIAFDLSTNSLGALVGPEWRSEGDKEREAMLVPLEMYLKSKQMEDIPPGAILCFAMATYAAPRLRVPNTASKVRNVWEWLKWKFNGRRTIKPVANNNNPFASGNHGN